MVVGLRIAGATEKFDELLEEQRIDSDRRDVMVLYTDGITEAMNTDSDLFGETRLSRIVEEHGHLDSANCASGSCARSRRSSAPPISTTT